MNPKIKHILKVEDGRVEPLKDLEFCKRVILVDKDMVGAEDVTFAYTIWDANTSYHKKHVHDNAEEIMYILSGRAVLGVNDEESEVRKGDTIWIPRGAVHWGNNPFDEPFEMLVVYTRSSLDSIGYEVVE
jgi:mannose-6-phosphate isomerase-like protein (cupin superfamily)